MLHILTFFTFTRCTPDRYLSRALVVPSMSWVGLQLQILDFAVVFLTFVGFGWIRHQFSLQMPVVSESHEFWCFNILEPDPKWSWFPDPSLVALSNLLPSVSITIYNQKRHPQALELTLQLMENFDFELCKLCLNNNKRNMRVFGLRWHHPRADILYKRDPSSLFSSQLGHLCFGESDESPVCSQ